MKLKILAIFFTLLAIWVQGSLLFSNGNFDKKGNLYFYDYAAFRDVTVHLSLVNELLNRFPPTNFAAGGIPLKNYHYFFDVFLSVFARFPGLSLLDLYFRIVPVVLSVGLCCAIYFATKQLTKNNLAAIFAIFFTIFSVSLGPIIPFIKTLLGGYPVTGAGNLFMMDQFIGMMVNPQGILGIILFLILFLVFNSYQHSKKIGFLVLIAVFLAISFGVKAYGGILFVPASLVASGWFFYKQKDWRPLLATFVGAALMCLWILYSIDGKASGLVFAPFWLLDRMVADINRLNEPKFGLLFASLLAVGVWWRWGLLVIGEFLVFLLGNLGLRVVSIYAIVKIFKNFKSLSIGEVFLYTTAIGSFFLPLFFNQGDKAYEVIQFFPYFSVVLSIVFTISLFEVFNNKIVYIWFFVALFLILNKREIETRIFNKTDKIIIPAGEIQATNFIRLNTDSSAIFLLAPSGFNYDYLWFSALSGRRTVYSGDRFAFQIGVDTTTLAQKVRDTFDGKNTDLKYDYVFISQTLDGSSARISDKSKLRLIFESDGAKVYKHE